jgi:T5SS/PEP-CTERM-associated repeat protein
MKYIPAAAATFCGLLLLSATSRAQDLYVGSNAANVTTNFTTGTNLFGKTYIGYTTNATNNVLNVSGAGTVLSNSSGVVDVYVGFNGSGNRLVVSNGGQVYCFYGSLGWTRHASNNSALVTGTNSKWTLGGDLYVGGRASPTSVGPNGNSLVVSNGGQVVMGEYGDLQIGVFSISNSVLVTGSGSSVQGSVVMGGQASGISLLASTTCTMSAQRHGLTRLKIACG